MNTALGPTKTSSPNVTPAYTLTLFWILTRCPIWTPRSTNTFLPSVQPSPMDASVRTWAWCHTDEPSPMLAPVSTVAVGWTETVMTPGSDEGARSPYTVARRG